MTVATRTQQLDIYAVEASLDRGRRFTSLAELQRFVDDLRETWWWESRYGLLTRVEVGPAARIAEAVGWYDPKMGAGRIEVPPGMRDTLTVTHELAHVISQLYRGSRAHDPAFAREYANLTYLISGSAAWQALRVRFEALGIDYE